MSAGSKRTRITVIAVIAVVCLLAIPFLLAYGPALVMLLVGGDFQSRQDDASLRADWAWENCDFSGEETYFVDVGWMMQSAEVREMDCEQLREYMPVYRKETGDSVLFLDANPATTSPLPDLTGLKLVRLTTYQDAKGFDENWSRIVLFDRGTTPVYAGNGSILDEDTTYPWTTDAGDDLLTQLSVFRERWNQCQARAGATASPVAEGLGFQRWEMEIVDADYEIHRLTSAGFCDQEGIGDLYHAFPAELPR
ncbi:MAG: hypothetical protein LBR58_00975 [Propionibacteriaceae bacterium]|jgi:hypothetical protein|nr:hypothetical protein [Propionibacteriaceae bacterium]